MEQAEGAVGLALALMVVLKVAGDCSVLEVAVSLALVVWVAEGPLVRVVAAGLGIAVVAVVLLALWCLQAVVPGRKVAVGLWLCVMEVGLELIVKANFALV